ncbi:MAG TPA: NPCBM/NEW2 domain-containing protein [Tepidisphaeraceae bacterium]
MPFAFCLPAHAGTLRTLDGKTYEGELKLEQDGKISIIPTHGPKPPAPIDLADVLYAGFRNPEPPRIIAGPAATRTENGQLPTPWRASDVGELQTKGSARYREPIFSVKSAGATVGGTHDAFCFVHQSAGGEGDADLVARVRDTENQQVAAGLMIRSSVEPDAACVSLFYFGDDVRLLKRARSGQAMDGGPVGGHVNLPIWMRLTRHANTVTAYLSRDGKDWEQVGNESVAALDANALAGLAVCGREGRPSGAHFDNVRRISIAPATHAAAHENGSISATPVAPASLKPGLMLRSGTLLAGAQIERADDGGGAAAAAVRFARGGRTQTLPLANVARIIFRELSPDAVARLPEKRTGVLLKEGDFVEGEFKGLGGGRVQLSSVLFGLARFDVRDKAAAVLINDLEPGARPQTVLRTTDGSIYVAKAISFDKDRLLIDDDAIATPLAINRWDVVEISAGAGRLEPLAAIKPAKVESIDARDERECLFIGSTGTGLPPALAGVPCERAITLTAGASATWDLSGRYRTLTFKCGVPTGVLPTAPVRFVVLADGKELFKSSTRSSLSDPLAGSLSIKGVRLLTLRTESTVPDPIPIPGVWGDVSLVK